MIWNKFSSGSGKQDSCRFLRIVCHVLQWSWTHALAFLYLELGLLEIVPELGVCLVASFDLEATVEKNCGCKVPLDLTLLARIGGSLTVVYANS